MLVGDTGFEADSSMSQNRPPISHNAFRPAQMSDAVEVPRGRRYPYVTSYWAREGHGMGRRATFGSVRKLPSGKYQARYTGPDLVRHKAPVTFPTKGEAEGWLAAKRVEVMKGEWS